MGYDGSGGYDRARNWSADSSAGIKILASAMDEEFNDFASAMTVPVLRDGQNEPTADLPMAGQKHTNVGAAASATNYARMRELSFGVPIFMIDNAGSNTGVSVSTGPLYVSVSNEAQIPPDGAVVRARLNSDKDPVTTSSSAGPSLTINGYGRRIKDHSGKGVPTLVSGGIYDFVYSSANSSWQVLNPVPIKSNTDIGTAVFKAKNAAGTVAGVGTTLNNNTDICRVGDVTFYRIGTSCAVSVSVSAATFYISALSGVWAPSDNFGGGSKVALYDSTNNTGPHIFETTMNTNGNLSVEPALSATVTVSADTVWLLAQDVITWVAR